jgi:hypothetical protein
MTFGFWAGKASSFDVEPSLPPAVTTTIPLRRATSTAWLSGSARQSLTVSLVA